jgi:hypothetical protein
LNLFSCYYGLRKKSSTLNISKYKKKILMAKVHFYIAEVRDEEDGILLPRSNWDLSPQ